MGKIFKSLKKIRKSVFKFVKKNWKAIVITALVVFTAGVATVGFAGMSAAFSSLTAAGASSFSAALQVAGSTLWAGATAIAGTLGIGPGAQGMVAAASGMQGATLGTGALAAKLGGNIAQVNMANAGINATGAGGSGMAASAGGTMAMPTGAVSKGMAKGMETIAGNVAGQSGMAPTAANLGANAAKTSTSLLGDTAKTALVTGGMGMAQGYIQGKMNGGNDPLAYFGVNMNGKDPSFILPGQINPETGEPATEQDAKDYNEWKRTGDVNPFAAPVPVAG